MGTITSSAKKSIPTRFPSFRKHCDREDVLRQVEQLVFLLESSNKISGKVAERQKATVSTSSAASQSEVGPIHWTEISDDK